MTGPCECDWKDCGHKGRPVEAADHGNVRTSPELCMVCLFVCCGERDDEEDELVQPSPPLHIHASANSGEPAHQLDEDCWCHPTVTVFGDGGCGGTEVVIDHDGRPHPSVQASLVLEESYSGELVTRPSHIIAARRRGTRRGIDDS